MADGTPALIADDIYKNFGKLEVLKGVSLTAHEGDVIAMLGSSGSGKSTFLKCPAPDGWRSMARRSACAGGAPARSCRPTGDKCSEYVLSWRWSFSNSIFGPI